MAGSANDKPCRYGLSIRPARRWRRTGVLLSLALGLAFTAIPAEGADGSLPCSVSALVATINTANGTAGADTLTLAAGCTYTLTAPDNVGNGLPVISSEIAINGNGATITRSSSAASFRIFNVNGSGKLTLSSVTVSGGRSEDCPGGQAFEQACGGGILSFGTLTVSGSRVLNNTTTSTAEGGIFTEGGGIENFGTAIVQRSEVRGNTASYTGTTPLSAAFGGGIGNEGSLTIDKSELRNNIVSSVGTLGEIGDGGFAEGSAIASFGPAAISNSLISGNISSIPDSGSTRGAVVAGDRMTIANTEISDNTIIAPNGEGFGGGVRAAFGATLTIQHSLIARNTINVSGGATASGGGIDINVQANVTISNTDIIDNAINAPGSTASGAGINNRFGATLTLSNSAVSRNNINAAGGGAFGGGLRNGGSANLTNVVISNNTAAGASGRGGGIRNSPGATLALTQSDVIANTASGTTASGGGISNGNTTPGSVTLTKTDVTGNQPNNCTPVIGTCS